MKEYELTVLIHPDLEADLETPLDKVRKLVKENGGEIVSEDNWGKKRLAYRIKGEVDEKGRALLADAKKREAEDSDADDETSED